MLRRALPIATLLAAALAALPAAVTAAPAERRCGLAPGQVPCSWDAGAYLMSGFASRYDVRNDHGRSIADAAIERLVDGDGNDLVVLVVELFEGPGGRIDYREDMTANDQNLLDAARWAHRRGARVAIRLKVEDPRGGIGGDGCEGAFALSYKGHTDHYAEVAARAGAEVYVVAGGLTRAFERRCDAPWKGYWADVLRSADRRLGDRTRLAVSLEARTLPATLDRPGRYRWLARGAARGRVDLLGVAGAFGLTGGARPRTGELVDGWRARRGGRSPAGMVEALHRRYDLPVVLDAIGFPRCPRGAQDPGAGCARDARGGRRTQVRAVQATYCFWTAWQREHRAARWFRGLWWWGYDLTRPRDRSLLHLGRRARGRTPAARIAAWNRGRGDRRGCG